MKKILLVDSNRDALLRRANFLRKKDYDVTVCSGSTYTLFPTEDTFDCIFYVIRPSDVVRSFAFERAHQPNAKIIVYARRNYLKENKNALKSVNAVPLEMYQWTYQILAAIR